jgi:hypothetical protein
MDSDYDIFEIVTVIRDFWLFDAECYQRKYATANGEPLAPGYYVVNWPEHVLIRRFTKNAAFFGPFLNRKAAQTALDWMHQERKRVLTQRTKQLSTVEANVNRRAVNKTVSQSHRSAVL